MRWDCSGVFHFGVKIFTLGWIFTPDERWAHCSFSLSGGFFVVGVGVVTLGVGLRVVSMYPCIKTRSFEIYHHKVPVSFLFMHTCKQQITPSWL